MRIQRIYFQGNRMKNDDVILQLLEMFENSTFGKCDVTYPPTRTWGTGLCGGTKAKPQPQPRQYPWIYPGVLATRANPYTHIRTIPLKGTRNNLFQALKIPRNRIQRLARVAKTPG